MQTWLFLCLLSITAFSASAKQVIYEENFDKDTWYKGQDTPNFKTELGGGTYKIQLKNNSMQYFWNMVRINPKIDYSIEMKLRYLKGDLQNYFGLVYNSYEFNNSYQFAINPLGSYKINKVEKGQFKEVSPDGKALKFNKDDWNILKISQIGDSTHYFINELKVAAVPNPKFFGGSLGMFVAGNSQYEFDYIRVEQDRGEPNIVKYKTKKPLLKENLGDKINSECSEDLPVLSYDGKTIYFTTEYCKYNMGGETDGNDIFYSEKDSTGNWTPRKNIGKPLNNTGGNWVVSISPDNNSMLLANSYNSIGEIDGFGVSKTKRTVNGWSIPKKMNIENFYSNSLGWQQSISADKQVLIVSTNFKENHGGSDLYVTFLKDSNTWAEPFNIGEVINTFADEKFPFLAADGVTLYFSSDGHTGFGGQDIFMTKRLDDTWKNWSKPVNLGSEINSKAADFGFNLPADGEYAYMVTTDGGLGGSDIVRVKLPNELKPEPVLMVYGKVLNSKTKEPLAADIDYKDLKKKKIIGTANSSPKDGSYKIILPAGKLYGFEAKQKGFYAISQNMDLPKIAAYREIEKDLLLTPIEQGATLRLNNLFFDTGSDKIREESFAELDKVVTMMNENKKMKIQVLGHTDNTGNSTSNLDLSRDRANSVVEYLKTKSIENERLSAKGLGSTKPLASNKTDQGKQQNRRVEVIISE